MQEGQVVAVAMSPDHKLLAVGTAHGAVVTWEHNLGVPKIKAKRLKSASDLHKGATITVLKWHADSNRVYSGDDSGKVCCVHLDRKVGLPTRTGSLSVSDRAGLVLTDLKKRSKGSGLVCDLESPIVQLMCADESLVVSSRMRVVVVSTDTHAVKPVGTKVRDGLFGACFGLSEETGERVVYSARPGSRVWIANGDDGTVMATLNCKKLFDTPSTVFLGPGPHADVVPSRGPQSLALHQLHPVLGTYLLATAPGILALINPSTPALMEWHADVPPIASLSVVGTRVYVHGTVLPALAYPRAVKRRGGSRQHAPPCLFSHVDSFWPMTKKPDLFTDFLWRT
jgi:hypothetical protein